MPKKKGRSSLADKLGSAGREAHKAHKDDEARLAGGGDLPEGIEGGIAQLVDCKFDTFQRGDNVGEYYFYAAGIVKEPKNHNGIPVEGLRTQVGPEPLCDTPTRSRKTLDDHVKWVYNQLHLLGLDTSEIGFSDLEDAVATLREEQPHFRFRTWKGEASKEFPNPRVNHDWRGTCEYDDEVEDAVEEEVDDGEEDETVEDTEEPDLDALAKAADDDDEDAQIQLGELAAAEGIDAEEYATWAEVAEMIEQSRPEPEEEDKEEHGLLLRKITEEDWLPAKGDVYLYKPSRSGKKIECEATAVFTNKRTCNLKNQDDGKIYKGVSWDKMEEIE